MKKLRILLSVFSLCISLPLGFVVWQTYVGLEREEMSQMRYFAETLFDRMEEELAGIIQQEESRSVDEYNYYLAGQFETGQTEGPRSPLSRPEYPGYILGYLQNNPDGSFQTPLVADMGSVTGELQQLVTDLRQANDRFNRKKITPPPSSDKALSEVRPKAKSQSTQKTIAERYLKTEKKQETSPYLGRKSKRVEKITFEQAYNIARDDQSVQQYRQNSVQAPASTSSPGGSLETDMEKPTDVLSPSYSSTGNFLAESLESEVLDEGTSGRSVDSVENRFQVEVAPFQAVSISAEQLYIFRRIGINNQIYRQGFVIKTGSLMKHLAVSHFAGQPLAKFSRLSLTRTDGEDTQTIHQSGVAVENTIFSASRVFPAPFEFLEVTLSAADIPPSPIRGSLNIAVVLLVLFMLTGLLVLYKNVQSIVVLSERKSQFVSAVTHELKTPLTNIRMYVEMLQQGMAKNPEKEQEYFDVLGTESSRLSSLINNVLELSKLERNIRTFSIRENRIDDVFREVSTLMREKLTRDGFSLKIEETGLEPFRFDREVLIQILVNLIENSHKFGRNEQIRSIVLSGKRQGRFIKIRVTDSGPGIPRSQLKNVFNDFYRGENELTRTTGGTGIGLALVKKFVEALGGKVFAENNQDRGCSISFTLPVI